MSRILLGHFFLQPSLSSLRAEASAFARLIQLEPSREQTISIETRDVMTDELREIQERFCLSNENIGQFHRCFVLLAQGCVESEAHVLSDSKEADGPRPWKYTHITLSNTKFFAALGCTNGTFFDALFDLHETRDFHAICFSEFLNVVLTLGLLRLPDIIQFLFFALDKKRSGRIARTQLLRFMEAIHGRKMLQFETAILPKDDESSTRTSDNVIRLPAAEERRNTVDHAALHKICAEHPLMLQPISSLQAELRRRILGETWWAKQEFILERRARIRDSANESRRKREEKRLLKERSVAIRTEVGLIQFLLRGKAWREAEAFHPKPIVTVAKTGEVKVDWARTKLR